MPMTPSTMPDPAPTVQQLLAFYLEAGVDCALTEEPVNRLSDPGIVAGPGETTPARPVKTAPAAIPSARAEPAPQPVTPAPAAIPSARADPAPAPDAAIASAR